MNRGYLATRRVIDARAEITAPEQPLAERVRVALSRGGTVHAVAAQCHTSEIFVKTMLDHYERLGFLTGAQSLCSSGLGACSPHEGDLSEQARVHCAGCPLTV